MAEEPSKKDKEDDCCKSTQNKKKDIFVYLIVGIVALMLVITVVQAFQINSIKNTVAGKGSIGGVFSSGSSYSSATPARAPASSASTGMVGGC